MNDARPLIAAIVVALGLAVAWSFFSWATYRPEPVYQTAPVRAEPPQGPRPAPPPSAPRPAPLAAVEGDARVEPAAPPPSATVLDVEQHKTVQRAVNAAVKGAAAECVRPWVQENERSIELVVDALFEEGAVVDLQMRGLTEVPPEIGQCVQDVFWQAEFPVIDGARGALRYQHAIDVPWQTPVDDFAEERDPEAIREAALMEWAPGDGPIPEELLEGESLD